MIKRNFIKIIIIVFSIIILLFFIINEIYNTTINDIIKIVIYSDDTLSNTHYIEVKPNGTITAMVGERKDYEIDKFDFFFKIDFSQKQRIKLSKEETKEIFDLANDTITHGNIRDGVLVFGGFHCDVYYKGFHHKIRVANEEYHDLYRMLNKIDNSLPKPINLKTMIPNIDDEAEWG